MPGNRRVEHHAGPGLPIVGQVSGIKGAEVEPEAFRRACAELAAATWRPEFTIDDMPAPQRIAPFAIAISADVTDAEDNDIANGRLILLHDPAGSEAWDGTFRLVTFARAEIDAEMAGDPMLTEVGWSWLTDSLTARGAALVAPSGSVTTVRTEGFGGMEEDGSSAQLEIRASWTPLFGQSEGLGVHARAWAELLCTVCGLPPLAPGMLTLPRRGREGRARR